MKKITLLKFALLVFCFFQSIKGIQAQCPINFTYTLGTNGQVSFTGLSPSSTFTTNYYWSMPGSSNPTQQGQGSGFLNPTTTYSANGIYTVTFGMFSAAPMCSVNITQTIAVGVAGPCALNIQSTTPAPNLCNGSATVTPPSNMCGSVSYTWFPGAFNGANISGLCQGTSYTVVASSSGSGTNCCSTATGVVNIPTVNPCVLNANFGSTAGSNGLINFTNTSTGTTGSTSYSWNFGDGGTSTSTSPAHTYTANGAYNVSLTVNNNMSPVCIDVQIWTVFVNSICNLNAGFSYNSQTSNIINFVNSTTGSFGPAAYTWSFGDGSPTSAAANPFHTYNATGTYTVILTANNYSVSGGCADTAMAVVSIGTICAANASFSLSPTGTPQFWNAFPLVPTNVVAAQWYWGDGNFSSTLYTSHTYSAAGNYSICLSVTLSCGASTTYCAPYTIFRSSDEMGMIYVNVVDPSAPTAIKNNGPESLKISVYPNPSKGSFNLKGLNNGQVSISIYNLVGKMVYQSETTAVNGSLVKDIELNDVSNGVYFVKTNWDDKVVTTKLIVENGK